MPPVAVATMGYKSRSAPHDKSLASLSTPNFLLKIIPHVDCDLRICERLRYYLEGATVEGAPTKAQESNMARFDGRVAIVTGSASGIGKEIALRLAAEGGIPVIADLNLASAQETAAEIKSKGADAFAVAMNVTDEAQVEKGVADTVEKYGKVDILVSNAGIQIVHPFVDFPYSDWKKLIAIHLDGAFLTTKACLKHMYAANYGRVIYMGSVHSKEASKLKAPYVTAKHGLLGLARVLAKEGAEHNVTANVVCPGFVRTPLVDKQIPEQAKELGITEDEVVKNVMLKDTVDGEFTTVQDVAEATLFFAAFANNALTGQSLVVSHGWFME
jgi:3-hydroxybutyrate dehydrogenase